MELTPEQRQAVQRARDALAMPYQADPAAMAARIGDLAWHLGEMLALIDRAAG